MLSKSEVKYIQSLKDKKSRHEHGVFVVEGPRILEDILNDCPGEIVSLYALESWIGENAAIPSHIACKTVAPFELEKISGMQTPQQVLAVVKLPSTAFIPFAKNKWMLMLDGVQDPGNMGTLIRTADWFGLEAIYCTEDCADCFSPKVVQAAMGSVPRLPVCYGDGENWLREARVPVYATLLQGEDIFSNKNYEPGIILIGNEGKGIRPAMAQYISKAITIPGAGRAESLNAAVAAGIAISVLVNKK